MNDSLCPTCGAYWRCEHSEPAPGLRYVPPDGPTYRERATEQARRLNTTLNATAEAFRALDEVHSRLGVFRNLNEFLRLGAGMRLGDGYED